MTLRDTRYQRRLLDLPSDLAKDLLLCTKVAKGTWSSLRDFNNDNPSGSVSLELESNCRFDFFQFSIDLLLARDFDESWCRVLDLRESAGVFALFNKVLCEGFPFSSTLSIGSRFVRLAEFFGLRVALARGAFRLSPYDARLALLDGWVLLRMLRLLAIDGCLERDSAVTDRISP